MKDGGGRRGGRSGSFVMASMTPEAMFFQCGVTDFHEGHAGLCMRSHCYDLVYYVNNASVLRASCQILELLTAVNLHVFLHTKPIVT